MSKLKQAMADTMIGLGEGSTSEPAPNVVPLTGMRAPGDLFRSIALERLAPNPDQPRREKPGQEELLRLAVSLTANGQLQPIRVRPPDADGIHVIIDGELRWRAARLAELPALQAVIDRGLGDDPERVAYRRSLIANLHRTDLSRRDLATALTTLRDLEGLTLEGLADVVQRSRGWIQETLAFAELDDAAQAWMDEHSIAGDVAMSLRALGTDGQRAIVAAFPGGGRRDDLLPALRDVAERVRAGLGLDDALSRAAAETRDHGPRLHDPSGATSDSATVARARPGVPRGRPPAAPRPLVWTESRNGVPSHLRCTPAVLATSLLRRGASQSQVEAALIDDITALRNALLQHPGGRDQGAAAFSAFWDRLVSALEGETDA